jgi:hypothetical protein
VTGLVVLVVAIVTLLVVLARDALELWGGKKANGTREG